MERILIHPEGKKRMLYALIKFGKKENLEALQKQGTLYLRPIEKLRGNDNHRDDSYEGVHFVQGLFNGGTLEGKIPGGDSFKVNFLGGSIKKSYETVLGNICSFYAVSSDCFEDEKFVPIDIRMADFWGYWLLITNIDKFFHLIHDRIKELKKNCYHGFVDYYDEGKYEGEVNLFQKRIRYEYQKEYRVYLPSNHSKRAIKLNLGSLEDISVVGDSATIQQLSFGNISQ